MSIHRISYRGAVLALWAFALAASGGTPIALAQSGPTFRDIRVDVAPLRAHAGDPTAAWVQRELPGELAQALAGRMARNGATLTVRIDYLTLGSNNGAGIHTNRSWDNISGVAIINGAQIPVRAQTNYNSSPIDQVMFEQSNHDRVSTLTQALAQWIGQGSSF